MMEVCFKVQIRILEHFANNYKDVVCMICITLSAPFVTPARNCRLSPNRPSIIKTQTFNYCEQICSFYLSPIQPRSRMDFLKFFLSVITGCCFSAFRKKLWVAPFLTMDTSSMIFFSPRPCFLCSLCTKVHLIFVGGS